MPTKKKCNICEVTQETLQKVLLKLDSYLHSEDPDIYDLVDVNTMLVRHQEALELENNKRI